MVKKMKWTELMTNIHAHNVFYDLEQEAEAIDDLLNNYLASYRAKILRDLLIYVDDNFLLDSGSIWQDLYIYTSSYKEYDSRFVLLLKNKLREYFAFYNKILTDKGVQRALIYNKVYSNSGSASSTERGTDSVTPQTSDLYDSEHPESDELFDKAIADYASSINKNKASSSSTSGGTSNTDVSGVTWEEGKKNLDLLFFNKLKDYIVSIPERIYSYYSLETIPVSELAKIMCEYKKAIWEMFHE